MSMEKQISFSEMREARKIYDRLLEDASPCTDVEGVMDVSDAGGDEVASIVVRIRCHHGDEGIREALYGVANVLSDAIINDWEPILIQKILDQRYDFLEPHERLQVLQVISGDMAPGDGMTRLRIRRKGFVLERMYEYLRNNDRLYMEGFVAFRLKDYLRSLNGRIEESVNDLLVSKEYVQWTELLQDLSLPEMDSPDSIHVLYGEENGWTLLDDPDDGVHEEYSGEVFHWSPERRLEYPDVLIASLVVARPRRVIIHDPGELEETGSMVVALSEIFLDRIEICTGCSLCEE